MATFKTLKLAVCLYDLVNILGFEGPTIQLAFLQPLNVTSRDGNLPFIESNIAVQPVYLAPSDKGVKPATGPLMIPDASYDSVEDEQFDVLLVPNGE